MNPKNLLKAPENSDVQGRIKEVLDVNLTVSAALQVSLVPAIQATVGPAVQAVIQSALGPAIQAVIV